MKLTALVTRFASVFFLLSSTLATAADKVATSATAPSFGSMLQVMVGLVAVLGLMVGIARLLKKVGPTRAMPSSSLKILGAVNVGQRERVVLIEVADQWIVIGVAAGSVSALATLPKQDSAIVIDTPANAEMTNFQTWLKQMIDRRGHHGEQK